MDENNDPAPRWTPTDSVYLLRWLGFGLSCVAFGLGFGWMGGSSYEGHTQRADQADRDAKLRAAVSAPVDGGPCPTYEQMRDRRQCQRCVEECYPMIGDGGRP